MTYTSASQTFPRQHVGKRPTWPLMLLLVCLMSYPFGIAQAETSKTANVWYFGDKAGIDFNSGSPVALTDSAMTTHEGSATISDSDGNLLFYTDGSTVWNKNHVPMPNGIGLKGNFSSTQSAVMVPKPGDSNIYYIFTVDDVAGSDGLHYSTVDITLDGGLGDITTKNIPLWAPTAEKIAAVRHSNQVDVWLITHGWQNNTFHAYLITKAGINTTPVVSNTGSVHDGTLGKTIGYMKLSPDGNRLALATMTTTGFLELFDFDSTTGIISNPERLGDGIFYGVEFSPDNTKLYSSFKDATTKKFQLLQFNLEATDIPNSASGILIEPSSVRLGALQLAPDNKIYVAKVKTQYLGVISNPNELGIASNYVDQGFYLAGQISRLGLPSFLQPFFTFPTQQNTCSVYAVHDAGLNDSQFLTITPPDYTVTALGTLHQERDIEALDLHPQTGELYAASGDDTNQPGYLYTVDKQTGDLLSEVDIRAADGMNFTEVDALSFHPDGTLWGWAQQQGLLTINTSTGKGTLHTEYQAEVEDLTWDNAGEVLYAVANNHANAPDSEQDKNGVTLYAYTVNQGSVETRCNQLLAQSPEIEALEALSDGTLMFGFHNNGHLLIGTIDPNTCEVGEIEEIVADKYDDIEGIAACGK